MMPKLPAAKQAIVHGLLAEGLSHQTIAETVGICRNSVSKLSRQEIVSTEQAEKIKRGLRNRWAKLADSALSAIDDEKLSEASAKDLAYIAAKATEIVDPAKPSVVETYTKSMQSYLLPDGSGSEVQVTERVTQTVSRPSGEGVGAPQGGADAST